jgi:hypothetical protein
VRGNARQGSQFTLQLTMLEEGAHEVSEVDIKIHVQPRRDPDEAVGTEDDFGSVRTTAPGGERDTLSGGVARWPPLELSPPPTTGSILQLMLSAISTQAQSLRQNVTSNVPLALPDILGQYVRKEALRTLSHALPKSWMAVQRPEITAWWVRNAGEQVLRVPDGSIGATERPLTKVLGDIVKARCVEWWCRTRAGYSRREKNRGTKGTGEERLSNKQRLDQILGSADTETAPGVANYDLEVLADMDTMDVMSLVMKESMRAEWKELLREEIKPLAKRYAAMVVVCAIVFLCVAVMVGMLVVGAFSAPYSTTRSNDGDACTRQGELGLTDVEQLRALLARLESKLDKN